MTATAENIITALDIGSSKVACFIARTDGPAGIELLGIGVRVCRGVRSGTVVDIAETERAIRAAVEQAERMAGETASHVVVSLNAGDLASHIVEVEAGIDGHRVEEADIARVLEKGRDSLEIGERELVHALPACFALDGAPGIRAPVGMYGERLAASVHMVTALAGPLRNLEACIERAHLALDHFVAGPCAAGLSTLVEDERQLGAAIIDMGGGTTSLAVFAGGSMIHADVIPLGGDHVTRDIARGLMTPVDHAERLKTLHGEALAGAAAGGGTIEVPQLGESEVDVDGCAVLPRAMLSGIIEPRLSEIFEIIRARLAIAGFDGEAAHRVVLTGGASQLPGMRELAQRVLGKQVRTGRPRRLPGLAEATSGPAFAVCAGLLLHAVEVPRMPLGKKPARPLAMPSGGIGRVGRWLRENF